MLTVNVFHLFRLFHFTVEQNKLQMLFNWVAKDV